MPNPRQQPDMLKLTIEIDGSAPLEHEIQREKTRIGRSHDNDIRIKNSYVSAFHAEIVKLPSGDHEIIDLGSFNGTFVNGDRVQRSVIAPGDAIGLGALKGRISGTVEKTPGPPAKDRSAPIVAPLKARKSGETGPVSKSKAPSSRKAADEGASSPRPPAPADSGAPPGQDRPSQEDPSRLAAALALSQSRIRELEGILAAGQGEDIRKAAPSGRQLSTLEADLADARSFIVAEQKRLEELRNQFDAESAARKADRKALAKLQAELAEARNQVAKAESRLAESLRRSETLASEHAASQQSREEAASLARQLAEARAETGRLREELAAFQSNGRDAASLARQAVAEREEAQGQIGALRKEVETLQAESARMRRAKEEGDAEAAERISQFHARISELKLEQESLAGDLARSQQDAVQARLAQSKLTLAESIAVRSLAEARQAGAETLNRLEELQDRFQRLEEAHRRAGEELADSRRRVVELEGALSNRDSARDEDRSELSRSLDHLQSTLEDTQRRLEAAELGRDQSEAQLAEAAGRLEAAARQLGELEAGLENSERARQRAEAETAAAREESHLLLAQRDQLQADLAAQAGPAGKGGARQAEKKGASSAVETEQETLAALKKEIEGARLESARVQREVSERENAASARLADLQAQIAKLAHRLEDSQKGSQRSDPRLAEIEQREQALAARENELAARTAENQMVGPQAVAIARRISEKEAELARIDQALQRKLAEWKQVEEGLPSALTESDGAPLPRGDWSAPDRMNRPADRRGAPSPSLLCRLKEKLGGEGGPSPDEAPGGSRVAEI